MQKRKTSLLLFILAIILVSCSKMPQKGAKKRLVYAQENYKAFDAIVVPGIPYDGTSWDSLMKARVLWSYSLYKNGIAKNIIYSGDAVYSPYREAKVMGKYALELGIPKENIFYDTLAHHSTENLYFSYLLAGRLGFKSIALATDPFQAFMLRGYSKKRFGTPVYHLPFVIDTIKAYSHLAPEIDVTDLEIKNFVPITEQLSFFKRFKGTMGKDIDFKQYPDKQVPSL